MFRSRRTAHRSTAYSTHPHTTTTTTGTHTRRHWFQRKNPNRQAAGYKGALSNPNTTHAGRQHAKAELRAMGRGNEAHVSLTTRIKRMVGIRSRPRRTTARY